MKLVNLNINWDSKTKRWSEFESQSTKTVSYSLVLPRLILKSKLILKLCSPIGNINGSNNEPRLQYSIGISFSAASSNTTSVTTSIGGFTITSSKFEIWGVWLDCCGRWFDCCASSATVRVVRAIILWMNVLEPVSTVKSYTCTEPETFLTKIIIFSENLPHWYN